MELPSELLRDLATLDEALGDGTDLAAHLGDLVRLLVEAVPTLVAVTISVTIDGYPVEIGVTPHEETAQTSIAIDVPSEGPDELNSQLVAYATDPGAFLDFRADAIHGLSIHPDSITLDAHVDEATPVANLTDLSIINQAIGILVERGHTLADGRTSLHANAAARGQSPLAYARALIIDAVGRRPGDGTD